MKTRTKNKINKRLGYKRYDNYCAHLHANLAIKKFQKIMTERDCNYISIVSSFTDFYKHQFILANDYHMKEKDKNKVKLFVFEVTDFKSGNPTSTNKGYIFYKVIREYFQYNDFIDVRGTLTYIDKYYKSHNKGDNYEKAC